MAVGSAWAVRKPPTAPLGRPVEPAAAG